MPRAQDGRLGRSSYAEDEELLDDEEDYRRQEADLPRDRRRPPPSRGTSGPPLPRAPPSPRREPSPRRAGRGGGDSPDYTYAPHGGQTASVRAHDEEVVRRMIEALEDAPQSLRHSKSSWQAEVFKDWMREEYPTVERRTTKYERLRSLFDDAVTDYERPLASEEGRTNEYSRRGGRSPSNRSGYETRRHIDLFETRRAGDDSVAVRADGRGYDHLLERGVQSRDQVGFTERSGVGVRNTVERQVELSPREKRRGEKRHKRKKGWPKHTPGGADVDEAVRTTFVSRVGGGHEVRTLEEQEEEDITIKVTHPDTTRA